MAKKKIASLDQAFLDDIVANPADDAPRLIYADWLDDHDQGHRAEFIRLQCRLATLAEDDPERFDLEVREAELLVVHGKSRRPALPQWARTGEANPLQRGFLDRVSITATDFLKHGTALFAAAPVQHLHLRNLRDKAAEIATSPLLARLRTLEFYDGQLSARTLRDCGASPHLGGLEGLVFCYSELPEPSARVLAGWPVLPRLRRLSLGTRGEQALEVLATPGRLASLERLQVGGIVSSAGYHALANNASALTHLCLFVRSLPQEVLAALTQPGRLPALTALRILGRNSNADGLAESALPERLTALELNRTALSLAGLAALTTGARLARMRRLELNRMVLRDHGAGLLAAAPLDALAHLQLSGADLDADAVGRLFASPHLVGLRELRLDFNSLGDDGAATLAHSPHLANLKSLDVSSCAIGPAGAAALAASPYLKQLRHLILTGNPLGDEGVRALAASPHLGELRYLELRAVAMGDEGLQALAQARGLGKLRRLRAYGNKITPDGPGVRAFADSSCLPALLSLAVISWDTRSPGVLEELGRTLVP